MREISGCVDKEEQKSQNKQLEMRVTKEAIMKSDPKCPNLIAKIVYDTKPVNYLSISSEELKWVVCEKDVYNIDTGAKEPLQFLRMC